MLNKGILLIGITLLAACNSSNKNVEQKNKSAYSELEGEQLARNYCSGCHDFPKVEILPRDYWGRVLPIMGFFLGMGRDKYMFADYLNPVARERLSASGLFPESPLMSIEKWIAINNYYLHNSPLELHVEETLQFDMDLKQFSVESLPWKSTHEGLSYLNFDNGQYELGFYNERESYYIKLDDRGRELQKTKITSPLVDVSKKNNGELLLLMGKLNNIDEPTGEILSKTDSLQQLIYPLERPINFEVEDFDNDGVDDILVAEFGKFLGGINIYTRKDTIRKLKIHSGSGPVKTIVKDVNNDGLKDFYVLIAQADESVYLFLNTGNLNFDKKRLLRLPAHYGTTNFELLDFDGDGDDDLICSSGDSGDYGMVLKPFHGIRLFENLGDDQYEQVWFHTQQGAYGTASADYDNDGDIDIASIGYSASYLNKDKELFIYFENQSNKNEKWRFKPHGYQGNANDCWILITSADVDNDGDLDVLLGANSKILNQEAKDIKSIEWREQGGMVTVLKNNLIK